MKLIEDAMLFVKIVQAGSLTQAALQLYSSKSQLSRRMSQLEQRLNAQLLVRQSRGLQLTAQGEAFYQACLNIQDQFQNATQALQKQQQTVAGNVSMTAPMSLGSLYLGPLLAKLMNHYPQLTVELDLSDSVKSVTQDQFDIAIRAARQLPDSDLKAKRLAQYDYTIAASPAYLNHYGKPTTVDELPNHRIIACITGANNQPQTTWNFGPDSSQTIDIQPIARVTHMWVQKMMALEGTGIIKVPTYWIKTELEEGQLVPVLPQLSIPTSNLYALYPSTPHLPQRIRTVIDYLAKHLPGLL